MKEMRKRLDDLRNRAHRRTFEAMGIDTERFEKLDKETAKEYEEIIKEIKGSLKGLGKDIAKSHKNTWSRWSKAEAVLKPVEFVWPLCYPIDDPDMEVKYHDHGPAVDMGGGPADKITEQVTYDDDEMHTAHPCVEVSGGGYNDTTTYTGTVDAWFRFTFTPKFSGLFCITPTIQLNGHHLLWVHSNGTCTPGSTVIDGEGEVSVTLTVAYEQVGDWVIKTLPMSNIQGLSSNPLAYGSSESGETHNGVHYNSLTHGGSRVLASLQGGISATIKVGCKLEAKIKHYRWAWVDLKATDAPDFYFRVPEIKLGFVPWLYPRFPIYP